MMSDVLEILSSWIQAAQQYAQEHWQMVLVFNTFAIALTLFVMLIVLVVRVCHLPSKHRPTPVALAEHTRKALARDIAVSLDETLLGSFITQAIAELPEEEKQRLAEVVLKERFVADLQQRAPSQ